MVASIKNTLANGSGTLPAVTAPLIDWAKTGWVSVNVWVNVVNAALGLDSRMSCWPASRPNSAPSAGIKFI